MKDKFLGLSYYEKLNWIAMSIKGATALLGAQMVIDATQPYLTLVVLAVGGIANEYVSILKSKDAKKHTKKNEEI